MNLGSILIFASCVYLGHVCVLLYVLVVCLMNGSVFGLSLLLNRLVLLFCPSLCAGVHARHRAEQGDDLGRRKVRQVHREALQVQPGQGEQANAMRTKIRAQVAFF